ncbi:DUF4138 domain-containing protein [Echinicola sp. 20G]|uniref:DUF4138 domain-containing protein n=1 Tax=Echinicola sp. 20G TaxID=2781961 RepID=UPI00190FFD24|nr:DUF4138 domain-containing protein [Echinicola sp. 20G]
MKKNMIVKSILIFTGIMVIVNGGLFAQYSSEAIIESYPIAVGWDKTTVVVFPFEIKSVDRGNPAVMVQKDAYAGNVLKLRAGAKEFDPTSLHIITSSDRLYHFEVSYKNRPYPLVLDMGSQISRDARYVNLSSPSPNDKDLEEIASVLLNYPIKGKLGKLLKVGEIKAKAREVFIKENTLFFVIDLENKSSLDFIAEKSRCWIIDAKTFKRTAQSKTELFPTVVKWEYFQGVEAMGSCRLVMGIPAFTVSDNKIVEIHLIGLNGERNINLQIKGKHLLEAKPIIQP